MTLSAIFYQMLFNIRLDVWLRMNYLVALVGFDLFLDFKDVAQLFSHNIQHFKKISHF